MILKHRHLNFEIIYISKLHKIGYWVLTNYSPQAILSDLKNCIQIMPFNQWLIWWVWIHLKIHYWIDAGVTSPQWSSKQCLCDLGQVDVLLKTIESSFDLLVFYSSVVELFSRLWLVWGRRVLLSTPPKTLFKKFL